ncbi:MAG: hypothetical protein ACRDWE_08235 [Acidimicrobiales bacterium]
MADRGARPKAWGVLAVSLALMALVAALSSTTSHPAVTASTRSGATATLGTAPTGGATPQRSAAPRRRDVGPLDTVGDSAPHWTSSLRSQTDAPGAHAPSETLASLGLQGTTTPAHAPSGVGGLSTVEVASTSPADTEQSGGGGGGGGGGGEGGVGGVESASGPSSDRPSASTPVLTGSSGPTHHGTLSYPASSVSVHAPGGGTVNANATWSGTPTLQLTITCPDGVSASRTGPTNLSLEVDDTAGGSAQCDVRLSLPAGVESQIVFTLTVEPVG